MILTENIEAISFAIKAWHDVITCCMK